jgi:hypothetical protein
MIIPASKLSSNIIIGEQIPAFCSAIYAEMKKIIDETPMMSRMY